MAPYYPRANRLCEAGDFAYRAQDAFPGGMKPMIQGFESDEFSTDFLERFSCPTDFGRRYRHLLADSAIVGFRVRSDRLEAALARNPILVTALNPVIGYERAAAIAKQAYREGRPVLEVALERTGLPEKELRRLLDPAALARGGIHGKPGGGGG